MTDKLELTGERAMVGVLFFLADLIEKLNIDIEETVVSQSDGSEVTLQELLEVAAKHAGMPDDE